MTARILIIEDEALVAMELRFVLEDLGHEVVGTVADAAAARRIVRETEVDLALVDIHLSDGPTGVALGRELGQELGVSVLFMTANPGMVREGVAGTIGAVPIFLVYPAFGAALGAASVCVLAASLMWMARQTGNVLAIVAVKVAMVFGSALRAILGFAAIGHPIPPVKSLVFAIEGALTSIVGIVPAGIGVGEVFSAAMALTVAVAPAAAFLAKAVNRLIGLVFLGVLFTAERLSAARVPPPDAPPTGPS